MHARIERLNERIAATREQIALQEQAARDHPEYASANIGLASLQRRLAQLEEELAAQTRPAHTPTRRRTVA